MLLQTTAAFADYKDTVFYFDMQGTGETHGTKWRSKDTYTMCYINIQRMDPSIMRFYIDGQKPGVYAPSNRTNNGVAYAYSTGEFLISNDVREQGRTQARLTSWSPKGSPTGIVYGVWSPDTTMMGKLPVLNP